MNGMPSKIELLLAAAELDELGRLASAVDENDAARLEGYGRDPETVAIAESDLEEVFDPAVHVTDTQWLATVMLCLSDDMDTFEALELVDRNRQPCLAARSKGLEPWEVAMFMAEKVGARTSPGASAPPSRRRGSAQKRNRKQHRKKRR